MSNIKLALVTLVASLVLVVCPYFIGSFFCDRMETRAYEAQSRMERLQRRQMYRRAFALEWIFPRTIPICKLGGKRTHSGLGMGVKDISHDGIVISYFNADWMFRTESLSYQQVVDIVKSGQWLYPKPDYQKRQDEVWGYCKTDAEIIQEQLDRLIDLMTKSQELTMPPIDTIR